MVFAVRVLGSTCLTAYYDTVYSGYACRGAAAAAIDRPLHTLNDRLEILRLYVGVAFVGIGGIERVSFYFFEYMRTYPIAAIGYDCLLYTSDAADEL